MLSKTKVSEHILSGFSMPTRSLFEDVENNDDKHRGKDFMKKFFESLREHTVKIINFKKMKLLTNKKEKSYKNAEICNYTCK